MPKGKIPYQFKYDDTPISVANQFGITPQQLIAANPGAWPASTGQMINLPTGFQQALARRAPAYNLPEGQQYAPSTFQQALRQSYPNAYRNGSTLSYTNPSTFQQALQKSYPRLYPPEIAAQQPVTPSAPGPQYGANTPYWQMAAGGMQSPTPPNFGPSPTASYQNIMYRLSQSSDPAGVLNSLPPSTREAVERMAAQSLGAQTDAQGNTYIADESQSPGGRFIQVGEVRWERNKNGRRVRVQYTGGGSWRNKRVVGGGRGQHKALVQARQQEAVRPGENNIPGFGLVNFSVASG